MIFSASNRANRLLHTYNTLIGLLRSLGFKINWKKVVDPTQSLVFLGINIDMRARLLSLDSVKKSAFIVLLNRTDTFVEASTTVAGWKVGLGQHCHTLGKTLCFLQAFIETEHTFEQGSYHIYNQVFVGG